MYDVYRMAALVGARSHKYVGMGAQAKGGMEARCASHRAGTSAPWLRARGSSVPEEQGKPQRLSEVWGRKAALRAELRAFVEEWRKGPGSVRGGPFPMIDISDHIDGPE